MSKGQLRIKFRSLRSAIEDRSNLSDRIAEILINSDLYKNADTVFCYCARSSEVDTKSIILKSFEDKKKVALPKCIDNNGNMSFYYIDSLTDLSEGMYGIMEPAVYNIAENFSENSICIVPGLAFDSEGYRLGYGKGYYDRFLESFTGISIGVCYEECLTTALPRDEFDKKVNYVVTEKTLYTI